MTSSSLNGDIVVRKGYFVLLGNTNVLVYYPPVYLQRINVYRVKTMDMVRFRWNNSVSGI